MNETRGGRRRTAIDDAIEDAVEETAEIGSGLWAAIGRMADFVGDLTGVGPLWERFTDRFRDWLAGTGEVAFTVALISLAAKMAKADGIVTADEIEMFRRVVEVPAGEERNVERLFDLARRDVAGFEAHAARIAAIAEGDDTFLGDVLTGLFHIAAADSYVHEHEFAFLERVGEIFGLDEIAFERIASGFVRRRGPYPYRILGMTSAASDEELKAARRRLIAECHPDRHFAHGLPHEAMAILADRMAAINGAWEQIRLERGLT